MILLIQVPAQIHVTLNSSLTLPSLLTETYWSKKTGHTLTKRLSSKKYTDLESALTACLSKKTCQGVVKEGTKKYYLYKDVKITEKTGHTVYLRGGKTHSFTPI